MDLNMAVAACMGHQAARCPMGLHISLDMHPQGINIRQIPVVPLNCRSFLQVVNTRPIQAVLLSCHNLFQAAEIHRTQVLLSPPLLVDMMQLQYQQIRMMFLPALNSRFIPEAMLWKVSQ